MILKSEVITSRKNQTVIWVASLAEKKYRDKYGCFVADGYKLFCEATNSQAPIHTVCLAESKVEQYMQTLRKKLSSDVYQDTQVLVLSDACFEKVSQEKSPQGIITIVKYLDKIKNIIKIYKVTDFLNLSQKALVLDAVRDPSNLGAILRSAAAFGTETLILSADCADPYNPKTVRAAMGALFRVNILYVEDLVSAIEALRDAGRRVLAAELTHNALSIGEMNLTPSDIIVIGNEGHGISPDVSAVCHGSVFLPISCSTESLNAAVAASIFLWEQR